ncbi:MAG: 30S ribosomal protein S26e, partial [Thermoproteota archaeon]
VSPIRGQISSELERQGTYVSRKPVTRYYCISCAIHRGIVRPRAEEERKLTRTTRTQRGIPLKFLKKQIV